MRTTTSLVLVLMGSGAITAGTAVSMHNYRACDDARAHGDPKAMQGCGGASTHGTGGWFGGRGSSSASTVSVARGGFGSAGLHFFGLGG